MKLRKKIYSTVCTFVILLTTMTPAPILANDNLNVNDLNFADSITDEQKEALNPALIRILSEEEGEIVSISEVNIPLEQNVPSGYVMSKLDFSMFVVAQRINEKPGTDNFKFVASGQWRENPLWELTDCIGLAWSDDFTLYDDECYTLNEYNGIKTTWCTTLNHVTPEVGLAYDVDLLLGERQEYVILEAKVYKNNSKGSANVVGTYGHVTVTAQDINVGFSGGNSPSISMSASVGFNLEMASPYYANFDY